VITKQVRNALQHFSVGRLVGWSIKELMDLKDIQEHERAAHASMHSLILFVRSLQVGKNDRSTSLFVFLILRSITWVRTIAPTNYVSFSHSFFISPCFG